MQNYKLLIWLYCRPAGGGVTWRIWCTSTSPTTLLAFSSSCPSTPTRSSSSLKWTGEKITLQILPHIPPQISFAVTVSPQLRIDPASSQGDCCNDTTSHEVPRICSPRPQGPRPAQQLHNTHLRYVQSVGRTEQAVEKQKRIITITVLLVSCLNTFTWLPLYIVGLLR